MYGIFWFSGLVGLLLLHFVVLPRLAGVVVDVNPRATPIPEEAARRYFFFWTGSIAVFTAIFFLASVVIWGRAGYLGTVFLVAASGIWLMRFLTGGAGGERDRERFELLCTLSGSVIGTAVGWGTSRLL
jgi:hypothetical protein